MKMNITLRTKNMVNFCLIKLNKLKAYRIENMIYGRAIK